MLSRADFEEAFETLTPRNKEVLRLYLSGWTDQRIANHKGWRDHTSVVYHLSEAGKKFGVVKVPNVRNCCRDYLIDLFYEYKRDWVNESLVDLPEQPPPSPKAAMSAESYFYIKQEEIEREAKELVQDAQKGRLIRIFSPRHTGKTLLCKRLLNHAKTKLNYRTVVVDFNALYPSSLSSLEAVWAHFLKNMHQQLGLPADQAWSIAKSHGFSPSEYLFELVLEPSTIPVVVVMENVDKLFGNEAVATDFFSKVRHWRENPSGKADIIWQRLRQVLVYSTDVYIDFPLNQSPFNCGDKLELPMFGVEQILMMAKRYGEPSSRWGEAEATQLLQFSGGIPYLVHLALHYIYQAGGDILLSDIVSKPSVMQRVYGDHLDELLGTLHKYPVLLSAFSDLIKSPSTKLDRIVGIQLKGAGVVRQRPTDFGMEVSCQLYQRYFESVL